MKRSLIPLLLALLALLCACGKAEPPGVLPEEESPPVWEEPTPEPLSLPRLSPAQSRAMADFMGRNRALIAGDRLYTFEFDPEYRPVLGSYRLEDGLLSDFRILAEDCIPEYLALREGRLYYRNGVNESLEAVNTDGKNRKVLLPRPCDYLQVTENELRYRREDGCYCRAALDGSGEQVLIQGDCYYPYSLGSLILYQDNARGERLCLLDTETGVERLLTQGAAWAPLLLGERLYYTEAEGLRSLELSGEGERAYPLPAFSGAAELLPQGERLLIRVLEDGADSLRQWSGSPEAATWTMEEGSYRLRDFCGDWSVDTLYQADGRVLAFQLLSPEGPVCRYLGGQILPAETPNLSVPVGPGVP